MPKRAVDVKEGELRAGLLALAAERGVGRTFCPSEVVRRLCPADWRPLMGPVREAAERLRAEGRLRVFQRGVEQASAQVKGPIRLGE